MRGVDPLEPASWIVAKNNGFKIKIKKSSSSAAIVV